MLQLIIIAMSYASHAMIDWLNLHPDLFAELYELPSLKSHSSIT
jgi:hypothetical protein